MPAQGWRSSVLVVYALILTVGGCGGPASDSTTSTATPVTAATTSVAPATTEAEGPQPLRGTILEPGEYVTTVFEPTVHYRIDRTYPLAAFQTQNNAGLRNKASSFTNEGQGVAPYRGVAVHNWWLLLTAEEILAEIESTASLEIETPQQLEFNGFPATVIEATSLRKRVLWENRGPLGSGDADDSWILEREQRIRFVIVSTPAGSVLITVQANVDEWDEFLPTAEEILAGISFPDLDSG